MDNKVKVALIVVGSLTAIAGMFVLFAVIFIYATKSLDIEEGDRQVLVGPNEIVPYFDDFLPHSDEVKYEKIQYLDRSIELSLAYDVTDEEHPSITARISYEPKASDAFATYLLEWNAQIMGLNIGDSGIEVQEDNDFFSIGDKSKFGFIKYDDAFIGNLLVFMKGKKVYSFLLLGYYIDQKEIWAELFEKRAELLHSMKGMPRG